MGNDNSEEKIEVESIRHLTDDEQVEAIATKFAEISNLYGWSSSSSYSSWKVWIQVKLPDQVIPLQKYLKGLQIFSAANYSHD